MKSAGPSERAGGAIGRKKDVHCRIDPERANALAAALGVSARYSQNDPLPLFFHQIYFWDIQPPEDIDQDGHARIGTFVPDFGLRRRMWAGGRVMCFAPFLAGIPAVKRSTITNVVRKAGRSGPLALVSIQHELWQRDTICIVEDQDLVYRGEHTSDAPVSIPPTARRDEDTCEDLNFSTSLLFRYSALTLNGHRIHYDQDYAVGAEGYRGLLIHGPLLAQLLILKAERELGPIEELNYRSTWPLILGEGAELCRAGTDLWVRCEDGCQIMRARCRPKS